MAEGIKPTVSSTLAIVLPPHDALKPDMQVARYRIGKLLDRDGFGLTYQARDTTLKRDVIVREFLPGQLAVLALAATIGTFGPSFTWLGRVGCR